MQQASPPWSGLHVPDPREEESSLQQPSQGASPETPDRPTPRTGPGSTTTLSVHLLESKLYWFQGNRMCRFVTDMPYFFPSCFRGSDSNALKGKVMGKRPAVDVVSPLLPSWAHGRHRAHSCPAGLPAWVLPPSRSPSYSHSAPTTLTGAAPTPDKVIPLSCQHLLSPSLTNQCPLFSVCFLLILK